ncbi:MAG: zinc metalloprotease HtpX [Candidatus Methanoperedens sp.]|nr:zinc metalloprotease HtpX [Candidatus Methanoperedens sp.]
MKSMFKTTVLLAALTGLLVIIGSFWGPGGMAIAFIFAIIMNFGSYWFSDKIVLAMYHAKEVTEAEFPNLYRVVRGLTYKASLPMPKVYIVESPMANAFATGRNPEHAAVAVTTGIMQILTPEELEGVLAHELAHVSNRDTLISATAATIAGVITMIASMAQWAAIFGGFGGRDDNDNSGGIIGFLVLVLIAPIAATIIQLAISRSREFVADESGAKMCGKPRALANALGKLHRSADISAANGRAADINPSTAHMMIVNPLRGSALMSLFSTHPPTEERIARLNRMI